MLFFFSKNFIEYYYNKIKPKYSCPLGTQKHEIDSLKYKEENLKMLDFIEASKAKENTKKIAEDDEYEYYVEE